MSSSPEGGAVDAGASQAWIAASDLRAGHLPRGSTIAKIQFAVVVLCVIGAAVCAGLWLRGGSAVWLLGIAGAPMALALFLGLGYIPVWLLNQHDPAPRAGFVALARAWWGEIGAALRVFGLSQPFVWRNPPNRLDPSAQRSVRVQRGVVFVHGFFCNRGLWRHLGARLSANGVPFVAVNLEPAFGSIDRYASIIDEAVAAVTQAGGGQAPLLVCHSMGGLAARAWLRSKTAPVEHRVLTIGSPHHGTWAARHAMATNAAQMQLNSPWLQELQAHERATRGADAYASFTCIYSNADNIVYPASTACLEGANNLHVAGVAHVHLIDAPAVWAVVEAQTMQVT